jgi:hypothetical protein
MRGFYVDEGDHKGRPYGDGFNGNRHALLFICQKIVIFTLIQKTSRHVVRLAFKEWSKEVYIKKIFWEFFSVF